MSGIDDPGETRPQAVGEIPTRIEAPKSGGRIDAAPTDSGVRGLVFDVQRFSLHDGPGIRTTVFLKGCPLRCAWCQNPESLRPAPEIAFQAERCHQDGACLRACQRAAILPFAVTATGRGRDSDRIARHACDACGACVEACDHGALELLGRRVSVPALLAEVERDRPFYQATGGGVTLSGGEPGLQPQFLDAFVRAAVARGLRVGIQTCGLFRWRALAALLPLLQFVHYDLKVLDEAEHRRLTGAGNAVVLANAKALVESGAPVWFRMPVVPGCTDDPVQLRALARFLASLRVTRLQLMRYHALGEAKLARVGHPRPPFELADAAARSRTSLDRAADLLRSCGLEVVT